MSLRGNDRVYIDDVGGGSKTGASKTKTANWRQPSAPDPPQPSTQDYMERAKELNAIPAWTPEQTNEAKAVSRVLESGSVKREVSRSPEAVREYNSVSNELYTRTHPATTGFAANLYQGMGIGSLTEALANGLGKLANNQKIADAGAQIAQTIDETAAYGSEKAPKTSVAGRLAGNLALYGTIAKGISAIPALSELAPVARAAAQSGMTLGTGTAIQGVGEASATGNWNKLSRDAAVSAFAGGVGGAAAYETGTMYKEALDILGLRDALLPNVVSRAHSAGMFGLAAGDTYEAARALTEEGYEPDWSRGAKSGTIMAVLGAVGALLDSPAISRQNKARIQEDIADVQESYEAANRALADPYATPEQRALLAQSTIDRANWARQRMDELGSLGSWAEIGKAHKALDGIIAEVKPYTESKSGEKILDPFALAELPEWTDGAEADIVDSISSQKPSVYELNRRAQTYQSIENNGGVIAARCASGDYDLTQKHQKFLQHVQGTAQYQNATNGRKKPQSFLTISEREAQEIIYRYAGKGSAYITGDGTIIGKEFVTTDYVVGKYYENGRWHETKRVQIIYSKYGTHIVPVKERIISYD